MRVTLVVAKVIGKEKKTMHIVSVGMVVVNTQVGYDVRPASVEPHQKTSQVSREQEMTAARFRSGKPPGFSSTGSMATIRRKWGTRCGRI